MIKNITGDENDYIKTKINKKSTIDSPNNLTESNLLIFVQ